MRKYLLSGAALLLAACQPPPPNDVVGGVGFESYADFQKRRAAETRQPVQTVPGPVANPILPYPPLAGGAAMPPGATMIPAAPPAAAPPAAAPLPQIAAPAAAAMPAADPNAAAVAVISDEQDFSAVAARETIESDQQRIDANKAQFEQIAPTDLPARSGSSVGPDIIAYAVNAPNRLGQSIYPRRKTSDKTAQRACARFDTPEAAQAAFLKAGGPDRDPKKLDPDGDGFACYWDPTPFQKARG